MIALPPDYQGNPLVDRKFRELIKFFNELEEKLQYPNCSGYSDQRHEFNKAQDELIMRGIL